MRQTRLLLACLLPLLPARALAGDLASLLARGPVLVVEYDDKGRFSQATAVLEIHAPPEKVWPAIVDFANYKKVFPKVVESSAVDVARTPSVKATQRVADVTLEIETPGTNTEYTFRYTIDDGAHEASAHWLKGDLKGSRLAWKVTGDAKKSLVEYTLASKNYSSLAETFEDDQQTITVGINVSAAVAAAKAVKRVAEAK